jgi:hypothetical protein
MVATNKIEIQKMPAENKKLSPCFWVRVLAGGLGASPQELHVNK